MFLATTIPNGGPHSTVPSDPVTGFIVAVVLFALSYPIIKRIARSEREPWLSKVLVWALILHLIASPVQIYVVDHYYQGIADWVRYTHQGAQLAPNFRQGDFTLAGSNVQRVIGDGSSSIITGVIFAAIGVNRVGAFLVFSWFSWLGTVFFYRAFTVTFPGVSHRRYAYFLFFLPSLIFWTSDVGKEAVMLLSVGVAALGAARVLAFRRNGYPLLGIGTAMGAWVRPNELFLLYAGFVVGMLIRPRDPRRLLRGSRRILGIAVLCGLLALSLGLTLRYLKGGSSTFSLTQISKNNSGTGAGNGSSNIPYSSNFIYYPRDVYYVLFDPTPVNAHSTGQRIQALENLIIIGLILTSLRRLRLSFRVAFNKPYVMLAGVFSVAFCYTFAALGNLGLITRERTLLFPLFLVLLCIPVTRKDSRARYPWEKKRFRIRRGDRQPVITPAASTLP
jgi:hypothetical protein